MKEVSQSSVTFVILPSLKKIVHKHQLNRHIVVVHEGKKPFKCDVCDAKFSQKPHLNGHNAAVYEGKKPFTLVMLDLH